MAEPFLKLMASCITTLTRRQAGGACLQTRTTRINMVDLPLGATEDRVCGTIDIEKALTEGVKAFEPGLLVRPPVCQTACRRVLGLLLLLECKVPSGRALLKASSVLRPAAAPLLACWVPLLQAVHGTC